MMFVKKSSYQGRWKYVVTRFFSLSLSLHLHFHVCWIAFVSLIRCSKCVCVSIHTALLGHVVAYGDRFFSTLLRLSLSLF